MPVFNVAPYLEEAFDSILNQSLKEIEVIAVNDGSIDNSWDIIKKYAAADNRILSFSQENQGQSVARNLALRHASGEYIYMMDSDDVLSSPDDLLTCYEYAKKNQADFIFFDGDIFYEDGACPISWNYKRTHLCEENKRYEGEYLLNKMIDTQKHSCVVWLLLIKRSYLSQIRLTFYPGIIHEDELFTTLLTLRSTNIYCLQKSLVKHRVRNNSTMGKKYTKRNVNCYLTVFDELFKFQNSPIIRKFASYTLSKVFYTGSEIPLKEKALVFLRAVRSGYLKYIGFRNIFVFWLK